MNIFKDIVCGKKKIHLEYEDEFIIAFNDINPKSPVHILIVPKFFIPTLNDVTHQHENILGKMIIVASKIAKKKHINHDGYRLVINCNDNGRQEILYLHMHLLGGRKGTNIFF
ncbi:HIT domain-containing protein [Enterobacteriaceae endosymbiont of Neohaemonia nigricornis]|uniref:HIT domain-containing protein n=1 Tax=Enterobacteriaceae endosymbiont of Neohaemonia nigricornis TaxID=2675792 RepID=UPI0014495206|nr:HIT domain-containing protein [Enterobacteriaceae endosymbiont of Neohaemonia nigricornis]QJC30289.1 HIT domain-containing protein [Enterobacteriaceae endosymbiont of Neohaemonia nigricornis]